MNKLEYKKRFLLKYKENKLDLDKTYKDIDTSGRYVNEFLKSNNKELYFEDQPECTFEEALYEVINKSSFNIVLKNS